MSASIRRPAHIVMRRDELRRLAREKLGINTDAALAIRLGIHQADISRYLRGLRQPPTTLIAAVLDLYGEPFERLFEIRVVDDSQRQAA